MEVTSSWTMVVLELLLFSSVVSNVASESPHGFISIDCGGSKGTDTGTKLDWETDERYLQAFQQLDEEKILAKATVYVTPDPERLKGEQAEWPNEKQLQTALVFYPGNTRRTPRSKFCYELPVDPKEPPVNYLLRATFPSRNLTLKDKRTGFSANTFSTRFYLSVDSTYVATIDLLELRPQIIELIVTALNEAIYVCLVPLEDRSSMPAISALELRRFDVDMYPRLADSQTSSSSTQLTLITSYLILFSRWNFGGDRLVRYPDDKYDRLWAPKPVPKEQSSNATVRQNITTVRPDEDSGTAIPVEVLRTAWVCASPDSTMEFTFNLSEPRIRQPTPTFYYQFGLYDVFDTSKRSRLLNYTIIDGVTVVGAIGNYAINKRKAATPGNLRRSFISDTITFKVNTGYQSDLPALMNSAEIYGEFNSVTKRTLVDDAKTVRLFAKESASELDQSGDPCLPVPWAWIICSVEIPPRVTQINLTGKGIDGSLPETFGTLNRLTVLDLSNNSFTGGLPKSLGNITALRALNLERNNLSGMLPDFTSNAWRNLETLSLAYNKLSGNLSSLLSAVDETLTHLDLRNNSFNGSIPRNIESLTNLEYLDLSFNNLFGGLEVDLFKLNKSSTLNLEGNNFTAFNLTIWYESIRSLLNAKNGSQSSVFDTCDKCRKLRLGNSVKTLFPESLDLSVDPPTASDKKMLLSNPAAFILLGENSPWCQERMKRSTPNLIERYLCRKDEQTDFWAPKSHDSNTAKLLIIFGVLCGVILLLMTCVLAYLLWRMWKRNRELRQIQEALAKENVKPPFFQYEEVKTAAKNFSSHSILGSGGFGTVYKAEFPDGNVLAVKKLIHNEHNVSDFFKELVNIMGIKHKHLIQLKGCCVREKHRMLVYEYAENRSLAEALWGPEKPFVLSWKQRFNICLGIARGLAYLHEELQPQMVHRDIKPQNILLDKDYNAKIADFGLVRPALTDNTQITFIVGGTRGYCPPEYMNEGIVSDKLDVYSFGIVLLEIVSGRMCINYDLPTEQIFLRNWALEFYEGNKLLNLVDEDLQGDFSEEEVLLILQTALACCQLDSRKRPTMTQVVNSLMKHEDIAIDIVRELRDRHLEYIQEEDIDFMGVPVPSTECEEHNLLSSVSVNFGSSESGTAHIELSDMHPR